jgi:oligoendopeptidase F
MPTENLGTEQYRWDLSVFYSGIDDPQIDVDVQKLVDMEKSFFDSYKGKLGEKLGSALTDYAEIEVLGSKLAYLGLRLSLNTGDTAAQKKSADVDSTLSQAYGEYMTFFSLELVALDDSVLKKLYAEDPVVARHRPFIEFERVFKDYYLSEPVESALNKRASFGVGNWAEFASEFESDLRITYKGQQKTLTEASKFLTDSKDRTERAEIHRLINEALKGVYAKYVAQTLYMITGAKAVETKERGYKHPMDVRNKSNQISDSVVDALHKAVTDVGGPLSQRYYRLKKKLLGLDVLKWSDRNAPLPFADDSKIPFDEALKTVLAAYESFSPTLANIIRSMADDKKLDVAIAPGRRSGAFSTTFILPGSKVESFVFMNYVGSRHDVGTLAHELGHSVHFVLSGEAQGPLMFGAPIAYAETASVFGEAVTLDYLKKQLVEKNDKKALVVLLADKIEDTINTVIRQICFSNFERRIHGMDASYTIWSEPRKNSVQELNEIWMETTKEFYGADADIFTYEDSEHYWSYIPHFRSPFYVYSYAFGQLLTHSLYAQREHFGDKFEPLYLDLLRAGGTKDAVELLKPFNLDPSKEQFWIDGINVGLGAMVAELEKLCEDLDK